jgi:hypothetical protein
VLRSIRPKIGISATAITVMTVVVPGPITAATVGLHAGDIERQIVGVHRFVAEADGTVTALIRYTNSTGQRIVLR